MKNHGKHLFAVAALSSALLAPNVHSFAYVFAGEVNGIDIVTHTPNYNGVGGVVNISIGINPANVSSALQVVSVRNVINTFNQLLVTTGNLSTDPDMTFLQYDFESVMLHELGHSLGLAHVNAASESGLVGADQNYTKATDGVDNVFNINAGVDGIIGSADDVRGDDVNLTYFKIADNNPFTIAGTVDATTYSRDVANLPGADLFAANADRGVGVLLGFANTEAVAQQGTFNNEIQRTLGADDVAGIRYAMAGLDEIEGTADDYTLNITYAGITTAADIVVTESANTGFAVSSSTGTPLAFGGVSGGVHLRANPAAIGGETQPGFFYNPAAVDWFFNDELNFTPSSGFYVPEPNTMALMLGGIFLLRVLKRKED